MNGKFSREDMFVHDMVHNNPGLAPYESKYLDPSFLKERGYDGKCFELFGSAQYALLWDRFDEIRQDGNKVFPYCSVERNWVQEKKEQLTKEYNKVVEAGLSVNFMMDIIVLPSIIPELLPEILDESGRIDIRCPKMKEILDCLFDEMFAEFPQISGIYIRYGETYVGPNYDTPYHIGNNPVLGNAKEFHQFLIRYLLDKVCVQYNKKIYYRNWEPHEFQFDPQTYLEITDSIPEHDNLYFCIKHTNGDFHRTYPFNQCLNIGKHKQVVEFQAAREYEGKGAYPNYVAHGAIYGFEEYEWSMKKEEKQSLEEVVNRKDSNIKGLWTWSRGGGWGGPYINGKNDKDGQVVIEEGRELWPDLNAYVISHWAKNTAHSDEYYVRMYAREELGMDDKDQMLFYRICMKSAKAVLLGRGINHPNNDFNVWWTRDQNISVRLLKANIEQAKNNGHLKELLSERKQSVQIWNEIVDIANQISDSVESKEYIVTTCNYGRILFSLYANIHYANASDNMNEQQLKQLKAEYDQLWKEWHELNRKMGCPTLFDKETDDIDMIGYRGNSGFDAAVRQIYGE